MEFEDLTRRFAAKFGIDNVEIEDNTTAFDVDGITIGFFYDQDEEAMTIIADLGQQSINADMAFGSMMLKANFLFQVTKGATLFQNPENNAFGIQQRYKLIDLDVETLSAQVEKLANLADVWKDILRGASKAEECLFDIKGQKELINPFSADGFMRA